MEQQISTIKQWLATGSINIFGLPMSGKDTVGIRLAETIGGRFISSGLILRTAGSNDRALASELDRGALAPTDTFRSLVLPYFSRPELATFPLILGSIGRMQGEEQDVVATAQLSGHPIKAALLLQISEADVTGRWEAARILGDRGERADDRDKQILATRIMEFRQKTIPVIEYYRQQNLLIPINADQPKHAVFEEVLSKLASFAQTQS